MTSDDPRATGGDLTPDNRLDPAAEQAQYGEGCPPLSNDDEERLFRPESE